MCIESENTATERYCRVLLTRRNKSRLLHEARLWVNVNHPSKRRRTGTCIHFPHMDSRSQNATATDRLHGRLHNAQSTLTRKCHYSSGEVAKFAELSWFYSIAKQSKLAEQWKNAHLVGKLKQVDEHLLVIKGLTRSARAGRRQPRVEKVNLGNVKAMLNRIQKWKTSTEIDTSVDRQKYITNQALNEHKRTPLCTRCARDAGAHCQARFENIRTKEFAGTETANHAADIIMSSSGTTGQMVATEEVNTDQIVGRDGAASRHLDEDQLQTTNVSLDQRNTTTATKQRAATLDCEQC